MKEVKDVFSTQASAYKKFRPVYPKELYKYILSLTDSRNTCWDCGTGNGQVATEMATHFKEVYATDISEKQIAQATTKNNIQYSVQRAENTSFPNEFFDLVIVAQAAHWFDIKSFNKEVKRVTKNKGLVCVFGYGLLSIEDDIDSTITNFYNNTVGPYWDEERKHLDNHYNSLELDFEEINADRKFSIDVEWSLEQMEGYLNSWSSVQHYIKANKTNPVLAVVQKLKNKWPEGNTKKVSFPIYTRFGRVKKSLKRIN